MAAPTIVQSVANYAGSGVAAAATVNVAAAGTSVTSVAVTPGTTPVAGNLLIVTIEAHAVSQTLTMPTGWTKLVQQEDGTTLTLFVCWLIAGASEPASYSFSWGTSAVAAWTFTEVNGQNGTAQATWLDATANSATANTVASTNPQVTATVTPTNANCLVLAAYATGGFATTMTVAAGSSTTPTWTRGAWASPNTGSAQPDVVLASSTQSAATATACAATESNAHSASMWIGGIVPASGGGPVDPFPAGYQLPAYSQATTQFYFPT